MTNDEIRMTKECLNVRGRSRRLKASSPRLLQFLSAALGVFFIAGVSMAFSAEKISSSQPIAGRYEIRQEHSPDGIGKFYMGREIAHVMGHQAADWLERPSREEEEKPALLLEALKIQPGDVV